MATFLLVSLIPVAVAYSSSDLKQGGRAGVTTYSSVETGELVVALTFDDGPHPKWTPLLLDLLHEESVPATFFVVGKNVQSHPSIVKRMSAEGHELGNHTWSHPSLPKLNNVRVVEEVKKTADVIRRITGAFPKVVRPPYGAIDPRALDILNGLDLDVILWSVDPLDWKKPGEKAVMRRVVEAARPGSIILAHDIHGPTVGAFRGVIRELKSRGYSFVTVSELLSLAGLPSNSPLPLAQSSKFD